MAEINQTLTYSVSPQSYNSDVSFASCANNTMYEQTPSFDKFQQKIGKNQCTTSGDDYYCGGNSSLALRSVKMDNTKVSELYFSSDNMKRIQKRLRSEVYKLSKGKFRLDIDQDEQDLLIAMRAVYLEYGKNLDKYIVKQVKALNQKTVDYIVPDLMSNVKQYYGYLKDISEPTKPIARPLDVNNSSRASLPSLTSVWGF